MVGRGQVAALAARSSSAQRLMCLIPWALRSCRLRWGRRMNGHAAPVTGAVDDDAREISGHALSRIEECIADGGSGDALDVLQDMVREFADADMWEVLGLREKHEAARGSDRATKVALREEILNLAYRVDEKVRGGNLIFGSDAAS